MARTQSKRRPPFGYVNTSNSTGDLSTSPEPSEARAGRVAATSETSRVTSTDAALEEFDSIHSTPRIAQGVVDAVDNPNTTFSGIQNLSDIYLKPFKVFNQVVSTLANIHPYAQAALGILTAASQLFINQANVDNAVSGLLDRVRGVYEFLTKDENINNVDKMRDSLAKIARAISDSAQFIKNYATTKGFWKRTGKNTFFETQLVVDGYVKTLDSLMQQYRDRAVRDIQINAYRVCEDLNLDGMTYADGAGLNLTKKCLEGTRTEILREIMKWIHDPDINAPRILWLHGQAGRGKSAIAHTIASWVKDVGGLGSCFCFARDRHTERREEKILTTIARDLADREPAFRRALADIVATDRSLKTTPDVTQQWQRLILEPLSKVDGMIVGNVVVVIDALDESGPDTSRKHILSLLKSPAAAHLPSNFRILLTSRPLPDIERALSTVVHVKATSLDAISAEGDIRLYVSDEFQGHPVIGPTEILSIAQKSDGLFEWARLACKFIKPNRPGRMIMESYNEVMSPHRGAGETLLDTMYKTILQDIVPQDDTILARFSSVIQQIMSTSVPLPLYALNAMRSHFPPEEDHFDMIIILEFMAPLLSGIADRTSVVRPRHASFYDFLTDRSRSGVYFVGASSMHKPLALASLQTLRSDLKFNICGLESSYLNNSEVIDLQDRVNRNIPLNLAYSCYYWGHHLERTEFDSRLAKLVEAVVGCEKLLFWFETLSLLSGLGQAMNVLASTIAWLQDESGFDNTLTFARDGIKFLQNFGGIISCSTPHLYISALPFAPSNTMLSRMLLPKFCCLVRVAVGGLKEWPAAQLAIQGHASGVGSVRFSPDGERIVSGSSDKTVRIWDADRGVQIGGPLEGHTGSVWSVGFSPDGKRIVSGSEDQTMRIWDAERGVQIGGSLEGHTGGVSSAGFSPDGRRIVSGSSDKTVRIWDAARGVQIGGPLEGHTGWVRSVGFSPDGKRIVSGSSDQTVRIWDAERGVQIGGLFEGHAGEVLSVGFSPDGKRIVSGSEDQTMRIWDAMRGVQIGGSCEGHTNWVSSVEFSPDGKRIVSGSSDQTVRIWDAEEGVQIGGSLEGHTGGVLSAGFSPDAKKIVSGSEDQTVRIWDTGRGVQVGGSLSGHTGRVLTVGFSPGGKRIVSGSEDQTVRIWDAERGVQIGSSFEGYTGWVFSVGFSPDGKRIVSGSSDKTVRVWDAARGVQIGSSLEGHTGGVRSVGFSPDGQRIASGSSDKTVRIWDADRGVQIGGSLEGHTGWVRSVAFSPDDKRIVSGSEDQTMRIWDTEKGVQIGGSLEGHTGWVRSAEFSPDGKRIVSGSEDQTVRIWDSETGVQIGSFLEGHTGGVLAVGFSPDGKKIVSGSADKTVRIWDAVEGVQIGGSLDGHTGWVWSVGFSPDGKRIVSGSSDQTVRIWDAERGVQIGSSLKEYTGQVLTVGFSPNGKRIVSGSVDQTVRIWDAERGVQIGGSLEGHTGWVMSVGFSHDGRRIVSGSSDQTVRIWDAEEGVQIGGSLEGHTGGVLSIGFSPDGKKIVSGSGDQTMRIWDAERGVQIGSSLKGHTGGVRSVGFSPDGQQIVSSSEDQTVRIWDAERGLQIGDSLEGHAGGVFSVVFSPDGQRIVSGSEDQTMRIWDAERGVQIGSSLEGHTGSILSVGFSPDGKKIVSGSSDQTVRTWDAERGVQIGGSLNGHSGQVWSVGFSPDGKRIVSGSLDATMRVWSAERRVKTVCFSTDSSHALHDSQQLFDDIHKEDVNVGHEPVMLSNDGWITGPKKRLLLWIPPTFWRSFHSMWTTAVIPKGTSIELNMNQMVHGSQWDQCFKPVF